MSVCAHLPSCRKSKLPKKKNNASSTFINFTEPVMEPETAHN